MDHEVASIIVQTQPDDTEEEVKDDLFIASSGHATFIGSYYGYLSSLFVLWGIVNGG